MWECPDYFELDGKDCLIMSPMRYQREGDSYHNINSSLLFTGKVDWGENVLSQNQFKKLIMAKTSMRLKHCWTIKIVVS